MTSKHSVRIKQLKDDDDFKNITISSCLIDMLIQFPKSDYDKSDYSDLPGYKKSKRSKNDRAKKPSKKSQGDKILETTNNERSVGICEEKIILVHLKSDEVSKPVASEDDIVLFPAVCKRNTRIDTVISNNGAAANLLETETNSFQDHNNRDVFLKSHSERENTRNCIVVSDAMLSKDVNRLTMNIETEAQHLIKPNTGINLDALPVTRCTYPTPNVYNLESKSESGCLKERAIPDLLPAVSLKQKDEKVHLDTHFFSELPISNNSSPEQKENQTQDLAHHFRPHIGVIPIGLHLEDMLCTTQAAKETESNADYSDVIYESIKSKERKTKHSSSNNDNIYKLSLTQEKEKNILLNEENISLNEKNIFRPSEIQEKEKHISFNEENISKPSKTEEKEKHISFNEEINSRSTEIQEMESNISLTKKNISMELQEKEKNISLYKENISKSSKTEEKEKNDFLNEENISMPPKSDEKEKNVSLNEENISLNDKNISKVSKIEEKMVEKFLNEENLCKLSKTQENEKPISLSVENISKLLNLQEKEKSITFNEETEKTEKNILSNYEKASKPNKGVEKEKMFFSNENSKIKLSKADLKEELFFKSSIAQENEKNSNSNHHVSKCKKIEKKKKYSAAKKDPSEKREKNKPVAPLVNEMSNKTTAPKDFDINVVSKIIQFLKRKHPSAIDDDPKPCKKQKLDKNISSNDLKNESKVTPNEDNGFLSTNTYNKDELIFQNNIALPNEKSELSSTNSNFSKSTTATIDPYPAQVTGVTESLKSHGEVKQLSRNGEAGGHSKSKHSNTRDSISITPEIHGKSKHTITNDNDKNISKMCTIKRNSNPTSQPDDITSKNQTNSKDKITSTYENNVSLSPKMDIKTTLVCPVSNGVSKCSEIPKKTMPSYKTKDESKSKEHKKVENTKPNSANYEVVSKSSEPLGKNNHASIKKGRIDRKPTKQKEKTKHLEMKKSVSKTSISESKSQPTSTGKGTGSKLFEKHPISQSALVKNDIVQISEINGEKKHSPTYVNKNTSETSRTYQKGKTTAHDNGKHTSTKTHDNSNHTSTKTHDNGKGSETSVKYKPNSKVCDNLQATESERNYRKHKDVSKSSSKLDKSRHVSAKSNGITKTLEAHRKSLETQSIDKDASRSSKADEKEKISENYGSKLFLSQAESILTNFNKDIYKTSETYTKSKSISKIADDISKSSDVHSKKKSISSSLNKKSTSSDSHRKSNHDHLNEDDIIKILEVHKKVYHFSPKEDKPISSGAKNLHKSSKTKREKASAKCKAMPTNEGKDKSSESYVKQKKHYSINGKHKSSEVQPKDKTLPLTSNKSDQSKEGHRKRKHPSSNTEDSSTEFDLHKKKKLIDELCKSLIEIKERNENNLLKSLPSQTDIEPDTLDDNKTKGIQKGSESVTCATLGSSETSFACFELLETDDSSMSNSAHAPADHVVLETGDNLMSSQTNLEHNTSLGDDISKPFPALKEDGAVSSLSDERDQCYLQTSIEAGIISTDGNNISDSNPQPVIEDGIVTSDDDISGSNLQIVLEDGTVSTGNNEISDSNLHIVFKNRIISTKGNEISDSNLQRVVEDDIVTQCDNEISDSITVIKDGIVTSGDNDNSDLQTVVEDRTVSTGANEISDSLLQIVSENGSISADYNEISNSNLQTVIEDGIVTTENNEISDSNLQIVLEEQNISANVNEVNYSHLQHVLENITISPEIISNSNLQTVTDDGTVSTGAYQFSDSNIQTVVEEGTLSTGANQFSDSNIPTVVGDGTFSADGNIISQAFFQAVIGVGSMDSDCGEITEPYLHFVIEDRTGLSDNNDISISHEPYQTNIQVSKDVDIIPIYCDAHEETSLASGDILKSSTSNRHNNNIRRTDVQISDSAKAVVENQLEPDDCQIVKFCPSSATFKETKFGSGARNLNTFVDPWRIVESDDHLSVNKICGDDILKPDRHSHISNQESRNPLEQQKLSKGSYDQQETEAVAALLSLGSIAPLSQNSQPLEHTIRDHNEPKARKYFTKNERGDINKNVTACTEHVDEDCVITNISLPFSNYSSSPACIEKSKVSTEPIRKAVPLINHSGSSAIDDRMIGLAKEGQIYGTSSKPVGLNPKSPYAHVQSFDITSGQFRDSEEIKRNTVFTNRESPMAHGGLGKRNFKPSGHEVMMISNELLDLVIKKPHLNSFSGNENLPVQINRTEDHHNQVVPNVYIISTKPQSNPGLNKPAVILRQGDNVHGNGLMTSYDISNVDPSQLATIIKETKFLPARPAIQMANSISVNQSSNHHQTFQNTLSPRPAHQSQLDHILVNQNGIQTHQKNYVQTYHSTMRHILESDRNANTFAQKSPSSIATLKPSSKYITRTSPSTNVISVVNSKIEASDQGAVENACQTINGQIADHRTRTISDQLNASVVAEKAYTLLLHNSTESAAEKATDSTNACQQPTVQPPQWQHKLQVVKSALKTRAVSPDPAPVTQDTVSNAIKSQQQTTQVRASSKENSVKKWKNSEVVTWFISKGLQELIPLVGNFDGSSLIELKQLQLLNPYEFYNRARKYKFPFNITEKLSTVLKELQI